MPTRTTPYMEDSLIEPTSLTSCPKQVHQSLHNHGCMDQFDLDEVFGNIMGGDMPKICRSHQSTTIGGGYLGSGEMPDKHCKLGEFQVADFTGNLTDSKVNLRLYSVYIWIAYSVLWANRAGGKKSDRRRVWHFYGTGASSA